MPLKDYVEVGERVLAMPKDSPARFVRVEGVYTAFGLLRVMDDHGESFTIWPQDCERVKEECEKPVRCWTHIPKCMGDHPRDCILDNGYKLGNDCEECKKPAPRYWYVHTEKMIVANAVSGPDAVNGKWVWVQEVVKP